MRGPGGKSTEPGHSRTRHPREHPTVIVRSWRSTSDLEEAADRDELLLISAADSTGQSNGFRYCNRRRPISQCLSGPGVEFACNRIQLRLGVAGETLKRTRGPTVARGAGRLDNPGVQAAIASGESHSVTSPRCTRARLYAGHFPPRYLVLYLGYTLEFTGAFCDSCGRRHQRAGIECRAGPAPTPPGGAPR